MVFAGHSFSTHCNLLKFGESGKAVTETKMIVQKMRTISKSNNVPILGISHTPGITDQRTIGIVSLP